MRSGDHLWPGPGLGTLYTYTVRWKRYFVSTYAKSTSLAREQVYNWTREGVVADVPGKPWVWLRGGQQGKYYLLVLV